MPVGVMLASMTSRELSQWAAYEKLSGPLGDNYSHEMLAELHEQGQLTNYLLGALYASWTEQSNPIAAPEALKRPNEIFSAPPDPDDDEEEEKSSQVTSSSDPDVIPWESLARLMEINQAKGI